ncbi:MAG: hypothetical protein AAF694_29150 [Bacteroidota bacterium]
MLYIIQKGKHSSFRIPALYFSKSDGLEGSFRFLPSAWYKRPDSNIDWLDLNKLLGISFGFHQQDSLRIAWRPLFEEPGKLELFSYRYNGGNRTFETMGSIQTDQTHAYQLLLLRQQNEAIFQIEGLEPKKVSMTYPGKSWGYCLFPYFGGNLTAPQDIEIEVEIRMKKEKG